MHDFLLMSAQQQHYLREFASRVDGLLKASLEREAICEDMTCGRCGMGGQARWRCKDCTFPDPLCRFCMRSTHMTNPLHRLECWTGTHYRRAVLQEVGVFMIINHRDGRMCESLIMQKALREDIQKRQDAQEAGNKDQANVFEGTEATESGMDDDIENTPGVEDDEALFEEYMDRLHDEHNDWDEKDLQDITTTESGYCCIVHSNGVHHLDVVMCSCRGPEEVFLDLAHSRFLPTTFSKVSTLFSTAVLDDFRLANLECKASAYQYWQRLRRLTEPFLPHRVSERYKELLRMSRLWRWMKKLKWAGFAQLAGSKAADAKPGELTNFCPACPQVGINVEADWKNDVRR